MEHPVIVLRNRLLKIGITIEMASNYPWVYLEYVNGNRIRHEDYWFGNHGFTLGFNPTKSDHKFDFIDIGKIFEIIRKYK